MCSFVCITEQLLLGTAWSENHWTRIKKGTKGVLCGHPPHTFFMVTSQSMKKSGTRTVPACLQDLLYSAFTFHFHALEKEMATHSSVLAWRIPGTGEPGGLPSMGLHRVGHD